jgi:putative intracellular protease/amidase
MLRRILTVVASTQTLPSGGPTGYTLEELAAPYVRFRRAGFEVDIASPKGGAVTHDPAFESGDFLTNDGRALLADTEAMAKLAQTIALSDVETSRYDAVFLVGGVPAAGDFDANPTLDHVLSAVLERGGVLAAVCHGVVGLTGLKTANGGLIAQGQSMTGFSLDEEIAANLIDEVAVVPEIRLREIGAHYSKAADLWGVCVVEGSHFITGQNPVSAGETAEVLLRKLS